MGWLMCTCTWKFEKLLNDIALIFEWRSTWSADAILTANWKILSIFLWNPEIKAVLHAWWVFLFLFQWEVLHDYGDLNVLHTWCFPFSWKKKYLIVILILNVHDCIYVSGYHLSCKDIFILCSFVHFRFLNMQPCQLCLPILHVSFYRSLSLLNRLDWINQTIEKSD